MSDSSRIGGPSLQGRIAAAALGTAAAVMVLASSVFTLERFEEDAGRAATAQAALTRLLARTVTDSAKLAALDGLPEVRAARLLDARGRVQGRYLRPADPAAAAPSLRTTRAATPTGGVLEIDEAQVTISAIAAQYTAMFGALFFAATGIALYLGRWLASRVVAPLRRLAAGMAEVARNGDFGVRVRSEADDEVGRLIASFNQLLEQLQANGRELDLTMAELVEAKDAAEAASRLKTQFLANVSHEIRTPLNGVLAMTQLMQAEARDKVQQERLRIVRQSGEALLGILNDILDVAKIESGAVAFEPAPFDLRALVGDATAPFAEMALAKGLAFHCHIAEGAAPWVLGDAAKLRQVLANLASNAVKFTDAGAVTVSLAPSPEGPDRLRLAVSDTGIGIAADKIPLLFRKFSQADASTTRRYGGAGLGLAICKELVEIMGGRIWIESDAGAGVRVLADLPAPAVEAPAADTPAAEVLDASAVAPPPAAASEPALEPAPVEAAAPRRLRLLAAEDNPTNQLVLRAVLHSLAVDLTLVDNGQAAVTALESDGFDLVLMDIQMPVMDGVAATLEIRRREELAGRPRTPIVALSANAMPFQVEEYIAAGMDAHLAKPIDLGQLYELLAAVSGESADEAQASAA